MKKMIRFCTTCCIIVCSAVLLLGCWLKNKPSTQTVFYVDQAYFQFKKAQLLACLAQKTLKDTCGCADKYLGDGAPTPGIGFEEGIGVPEGTDTQTAHFCCPCLKSDICSPCPGETCNTPHCECERAIIVTTPEEARNNSLLLFKVDEKGEPIGEPLNIFKKRRLNMGRQHYVEFVLPADFNQTVAISYRGANMGLFKIKGGMLSDWEPGNSICNE